MTPALEAKLVAVFRRRKDLGDELPKPACYAVAKAKGHSAFERIRVEADEGPAPVSFLGLDGSLEYHRAARSAHVYADGPAGANSGERALCVQTTAHVNSVMSFEASLQPPLRERLENPMRPGCWGENLHLDGGEGFSAETICVGDEFSVFRPGTPDDVVPVLVTQVSMPRCPCSKVDMRFGKTFTAAGVRCHCARTGHAGFFLRVLRPGTLLAGDVFRLTARPHPRWTLARIQRLLYGSDRCQMAYLGRGVVLEEWMGTQAELEELANIPELGICEYREELFRMIPSRPAIGRYASAEKTTKKYIRGWGWDWYLLPCAPVVVFLLPFEWDRKWCICLTALALALASVLFRLRGCTRYPLVRHKID